MNTDETRAAVQAARSAHARALLGAVNHPEDPEARTLLRAAVQDGRAALRAHREAAAAGIVAQIGDGATGDVA